METLLNALQNADRICKQATIIWKASIWKKWVYIGTKLKPLVVRLAAFPSIDLPNMSVVKYKCKLFNPVFTGNK